MAELIFLEEHSAMERKSYEDMYFTLIHITERGSEWRNSIKIQ